MINILPNYENIKINIRLQNLTKLIKNQHIYINKTPTGLLYLLILINNI